MKRKIFEIITSNKLFIKFIYALIIINVLCLIFESYKEIRMSYGEFFDVFEIWSVIIFTIEYVLRLWTADLDERYTGNSFQKRVKFVFSWLGLIDLLAILPFYLPLIFVMDLRVLRILRLFRLLRIFKLGRYSKPLKTLIEVFRSTRSEIGMTLFVIFILMVLSSTLMFYIESEAQPETFSSIGHTLWWAIATLTTIGYGDIYPITTWGKMLSGVIALIGIGFVALPTGIISSAYIENIQKQKQKKQKSKPCTCPNCGTVIPAAE